MNQSIFLMTAMRRVITLAPLFLFLVISIPLNAYAVLAGYTEVPGNPPYEFALNESTGVPTFSYPISIPADSSGRKIAMSVVYNGSKTQGLAGVGFTVSGFESISRCGSNLHKDAFYLCGKYLANIARKFVLAFLHIVNLQMYKILIK